MFNVSPLVFNNFFQTLAPFVYASVNKPLRKFSPFLDYCQLQLINRCKFPPKVNFFLQSSPYGIIDWVQIRTVWWPHIWFNEGDILLMQKVNSVSGCVRLCSVLLQCPVMATTFRLNITKQTLSENMVTVMFTVTFAPGSTDTTLGFPTRDNSTETMILRL